MKTAKKIGLLLCAALFFQQPSITAASEPTAPDTMRDEAVSYADWNSFLSKLVFEVGMPDRAALSRPSPRTGSGLYRGNKKITRTESNRFLYHLLTDKGVEALGTIRLSLENTASDTRFASLPGDARLALWLNLRNIAIIELLAKHYPKKNAQDFVEKRLNDPYLRINGDPWSIADIEKHVVNKWRDPLVIYGFHRGHIGSPNIRRRAYTADTVWDDLKSNAREFTSSLRGIRFHGKTAKISAFYKTLDYAFPDFQTDLKAHLETVVTGYMLPKLLDASVIKATVRDGTISDLYGGVTMDIQTYSDNSAGILSANLGGRDALFVSRRQASLSISRYPPQVRELLYQVAARISRQNNQGSVEIETYEREETEEKTP